MSTDDLVVDANLVVDASVALKLFLPEQGSEQAKKVFSREEGLLFAPSLLIEEATNILWKKLQRLELNFDQAQLILDHLPDLFDDWTDGRSLRAQALLMAHQLNHPAYDCYYLALAVKNGCRLITADRRFVQSLRGSPWEQIAYTLEGY